MLTQHKKLMDEAQRLEPSVMVTERNWSALLEMQDRLFRQQMQLDTDLKMLLTKAGRAGSPDRDADERSKISQKQAGSLNERYSSNCKALTENTKNCPDHDPERYEEAAFEYGTGSSGRKSVLCAWISITAVILCAALCSLAVLWSR